jgi:prolyl oligopeptidase
LLDDEVRWVKWSQPEWTPDSTGFYYARYEEPTETGKFLAANSKQRLCFHRLGTPQESDALIYERPDEPEWGFGAKVTEDGRYLIVTIWRASIARHRVMYRDLAAPESPWVDLVMDFDHEYTLVGTEGSTFYFLTELDAPLRRVIAIDVSNANPTWREIVPQSGDALRSVSRVGDSFFVSYLHDAKSRVAQFDLAGKLVREVALPGIGTARGFGGRRGHRETFYSFSGFASPPTQYRFDLATGKSEIVRRDEVAFDSDDYVSRQVFCESADGTRFPMFLAHRKDLEPDGERSVLLYGYGGFNVTQTPSFSVSRLAWMEMGGVFALANLRGGGEYGEAWHQAGMKLQKQNTFDDFIAAAEWLVDNGYSKPEKIGIQGGSNGGLLVGACMTQRPDLFGCALPAVGVMDMLRYPEFTGGRFWTPDYGDPQVPEEFDALYAYSPYHNLKEGVAYPATLVTTADTDDRVVPGHSFKFAAALQHAQQGTAPVLIRIETRAGHGSGKPTDKVIHEVADTWAFLAEHTELEWTPALRMEARQ